MTSDITDRDLNVLESCANWLETRSNAVVFKYYKELMQGYAKSLRNLRERLKPIAVEKPVTLDEIFGKTKD